MRGLTNGLLIAALLWSFLFVFATYLLAHDAAPTVTNPLGWKYGFECCSLYDCSQSQPDDIKETQMGYVVKRTGEVIKYGDKRIKMSKDEYFHRCAPQGDMTAAKSICLYIPDRGY